MATALDAITSAINQYGAANPYGTSSDDAINSINQSSASSLQDTLNRLKQKINDSLTQLGQQTTDTTNQYDTTGNTLNQNLQAIPASYQPDYNSHAAAAALALRNVIEAAANRGDNGGMAQENQLAVNSAQQNADASTDTSKNSDIQNVNNQISTNNTSKAAALQKIIDQINQTNTQGETDLGSAIANSNQSRLSNVAAQTAAEATAAEKAQEADAANQTKLLVAQINHSGSSSSGSSGSSAATPTQAQINSMTNGQGPVAAINNIVSAYGAGTQAADNALANVGYTGISFDSNNQPHVLNTLSDYATYGLNPGKMYDASGNAHTISTLAEYKGALALGYTPNKQVNTSRGSAIY